ncbi:MAG: hypothetical protein JW874_11055 [Spirochaetales bacterium]|nr:hypothetical protein [Spirochaetales bacterium]
MEKMLKNNCKNGNKGFSFAVMLRLLLDDTGLKPSAISSDLNRERSLVYKWLSGAVTPPDLYFPLLAAIVVRRTPKTRKHILEKDLRNMIGRISIADDIRTKILATESLEDLVSECLYLSVIPCAAIDSDTPKTGDLLSQIIIIAGALFAGVAGGVFWNTLNHIFGWPYFMGTENANLIGIHALIWGVITTVPIPLPLLFLYRGEKRKLLVLPMILFTLTGSLAAFAFHSIGIREFIISAGWNYRMQETVVNIIFSLVLSIPPLLVSTLVLSRARLIAKHGIILTLPTLVTLAALCMTFLIDRPISELVQLRGFVVGFILRLTLFFSLLWAGRLSANR